MRAALFLLVTFSIFLGGDLVCREDFFSSSYSRLWGFLLHLSYYFTLSSARFSLTHLVEVRCIITIPVCFFLSGLLFFFSFGKKYSGGVLI